MQRRAESGTGVECENPRVPAPPPVLACWPGPSAGKRRGAPVVAGRPSRCHSRCTGLITGDLGVGDRTGRAQHSANDGLHDNDVGLPSLMNIYLPACVRNASTARTHILQLQWRLQTR